MLKGRSALITGSLDGIGFAIAQALARQGCAVMRTWGPFDALPVEKWNYALAVNLSAPFHVIRLTRESAGAFAPAPAALLGSMAINVTGFPLSLARRLRNMRRTGDSPY